MKNRTLIAVEQQIAAMGCEVYEIGLFKPHTPESDPREPEMLPRTWDRATLLKSVPWLRYQNSQGRNIYIRPKGEHHLSMVDDLTADAIKRMKAEGYTPALVVETSPGNFQAWLNHGQVLPQRLSTLAARSLAERFGGDKGAADWRHFGRLAGFTNRKDKYRDERGTFPYVHLTERSLGEQFARRTELLGIVVALSDVKSAAGVSAPNDSRLCGPLLTIEDFRARSEYGGDGNRIDLAYSIYALARGGTIDAIATAIKSRDLSKKGIESRQNSYTTRTIAKAERIISRR